MPKSCQENTKSSENMEEMYKTYSAKSEKFNYTLLSLTFASLALSFQYAPKMGTQWPWALIVAWTLFLLSAICGGWRLAKEVKHARLNYAVLRLESFIRERRQNLENPAFLSSLQAGNVLDDINGTPMTEAQVRQNLKEENAKLATGRHNMENAAKWMHELFLLQFWMLILAIGLNGAFAAQNFLYLASAS